MFTFTTNRLSRESARFVDVVHTAGRFTSIEAPIGHADFFPNGLTHEMPGCEDDWSVEHKCSHFRAFEYFIESIGR